jgi:hypothetical protein
MLRAYLAGIRTGARCWGLVTVLWLIEALFGAAFAIASGMWLTGALDGSLATRTLFRRIDADVLVDLWVHHQEGLRVLLALAAVLAALHTIVWWWLHAVVVAGVQRPPARERAPWIAGLAYTPAFAALFAIAATVLGVCAAVVGSGAYALIRATRTDPSPLVWEHIGAAAVVVWAPAYVFLTAVHDHARIRVCRAESGAVAAYHWAFGFVLRGGERALPLAVLVQLTALAVWVGSAALGLAVPLTAEVGLTSSLVIGELWIWLRVWTRVWSFAAQSELQP